MNRRAVIAMGVTAVAALGVAWWLLRSSPTIDSTTITWPPLPRRVTVEVLNGGGRQGAARDVALRLRDTGLDVVYFGNAPLALTDAKRVDHRILVRRGDSLGVGRATAVLGTVTVSDAPDPHRLVDLTIVLGRPGTEPPSGP